MTYKNHSWIWKAWYRQIKHLHPDLNNYAIMVFLHSNNYFKFLVNVLVFSGVEKKHTFLDLRKQLIITECIDVHCINVTLMQERFNYSIKRKCNRTISIIQHTDVHIMTSLCTLKEGRYFRVQVVVLICLLIFIFSISNSSNRCFWHYFIKSLHFFLKSTSVHLMRVDVLKMVVKNEDLEKATEHRLNPFSKSLCNMATYSPAFEKEWKE